MKILIVEDEQDLRETIRTSLLKEKFVVETAADYFSALDKINDYDYDCILLDIMLPGGSGLDRPLLSGNRPSGDHRIPAQAHGGRNSGVSSRAGGCGAVGCSDGIGGIFSRTGALIGSLKDIEKTIEKNVKNA